MQLGLDHLLSTIGGGVIVLAIARWAIMQALGDLKNLGLKVQEISESLSGIRKDLERVGEHEILLREHARKLAYYEGVNGSKPLQ